MAVENLTILLRDWLFEKQKVDLKVVVKKRQKLKQQSSEINLVKSRKMRPREVDTTFAPGLTTSISTDFDDEEWKI